MLNVMCTNNGMRCFNHLKQTWLISLLLCNVSFAQTTLNQVDSLGKKHGKWIVYLDKTGDELRDSSHAVFSRYTWYDHGKNLQPMGGFIENKGKLIASDSTKHTGIKMLHGEYLCYNKKGKLRFLHVFQNGEYVLYKCYFGSGQLNEVFDYNNHWKDQPHSWLYVQYDKSGKIKYKGHFRKGNKGWVIYPD
jgi:antitoxin component YwqK of YwqJK toxin-antitoxin module